MGNEKKAWKDFLEEVMLVLKLERVKGRKVEVGARGQGGHSFRQFRRVGMHKESPQPHQGSKFM